MLSAAVRCAAAAWLCCCVAGTDPLIEDFRGFLREVFHEVGRNWSDVRAIPDTEEDMGEYTYDFVTDDQMFSTAVGEMYGKVTRLSAILVFEANVSDPSAVTAGPRSFQLQPTTEVTVEEISHQNVTDVATFSPYIDNSLVSFITKKALPALRDDIEAVLNATFADANFNMSSEAAFATTTTTSRTTASPATTHTGTSTSASESVHSPTSTESASSKTSPGTGPSGQGTGTTSLTKGTDAGKSIDETSSEIRKPEIKDSLASKNAKFRRQSNSLEEKYTRKATVTTARTTETVHEKWLIANFNLFIDKLLVSTGKRFVSQNMTPYNMLDGEEEMFKKAEGSVNLTEGLVSGLDDLGYGDKIAVELDGESTTLTADFNFKNVTFRFNFSSGGKPHARGSGLVLGHVTGLRGQLTFSANSTDAPAVRYAFRDLRLLPGPGYEAAVLSGGTLSGGAAREVSHAAGSSLRRNFLPRLQQDLRRGVEAASCHGRGAVTSSGAAVLPPAWTVVLAVTTGLLVFQFPHCSSRHFCVSLLVP
ncbi:uncharacterized protein LOC134540237 isoform X3 [Bacillus rossius redtenbacheri]|uniref:uncharacterized protein LOC134540237 isoform X3 n=1 Tax=Bacillus rossius redtenbacheri TaxID=93214 RepID=UPI002FDDC704